jgi:protein-disulfide isomerase
VGVIKQGHSRRVTIVVVSAILVFVLLVLLSQLSAREGRVQELLAEVPQDGTTLGSEDAPVTVYLYEDLQCPACARFARETFPDLAAGYVEPGEVKVVSETLTIIGPDRVSAAEAALAAGEQDHYWEYSTLFFQSQERENSGYVTDDFLTSIAEETQGLDVSAWNEARQSGSFDSEIDEAQTRARDEGVEGTPTLVVVGPGRTSKLVGVVPIGEVASAIDEVRAS